MESGPRRGEGLRGWGTRLNPPGRREAPPPSGRGSGERPLWPPARGRHGEARGAEEKRRVHTSPPHHWARPAEAGGGGRAFYAWFRFSQLEPDRVRSNLGLWERDSLNKSRSIHSVSGDDVTVTENEAASASCDDGERPAKTSTLNTSPASPRRPPNRRGGQRRHHWGRREPMNMRVCVFVGRREG